MLERDRQNRLRAARERLGLVSAPEVELLLLLREIYRYGRIEIEVRDGVPVDIVKTVERVRLGEFTKGEPPRVIHRPDLTDPARV